jgi:septum formation protein
MLKNNGISPIIIPSSVDENLPFDLDMQQAVMYLALKKALNVEKIWLSDNKEQKEGFVIIAADTIVYKNGIIGKPADWEDAERTLKLLRNDKHSVATGVALVSPGRDKRSVFCEVTEVFFKNYSDDDITVYLNTKEPWDKAGSYAIQGAWGIHIDRIEGDYDNVIGFPWTRIRAELNEKWPEIELKK